MSLDNEWRRRIEYWQEGLKKLFFRELSVVEPVGFVTTEQLTVQEALTRRFEPMVASARWGAKWQYAWFKCELTTPAEAASRRPCR